MDRSQKHIAVWSLALALACPGLALAQDEVGGSADIEGGATEASDVEMGMGGSTSYSSSGGGSSSYSSSSGTSSGGGGGSDFSGGGGGGGLRLGFQGRLDALNLVRLADPVTGGGVDVRRLMVPYVTPGVRLIDGKLFLGLGLGFAGNKFDTNGGEASQSGFSLSPLVSYDLISESSGALALVGWFNFASLGQTEFCAMNGTCMDQNDDRTGIGLNLGAQIRGKLSEALAIGTEWGWGFLSVSGPPDSFAHGIFGTLLFEASVGL